MTTAAQDTVRPIVDQALEKATGSSISHGFFTREGGVSLGLYRGLNVGLGSNDERKAVHENRARVAAHFGAGIERLATVHQVHSPRAVTVDHTYGGERPEADALVTATPGLVLGVLTADCGPILFADPDAGVIGAAHAGWKGALTGVIEATIEAMEGLGSRRSQIHAVLGPSISQANYEVGAEFRDRFLAEDGGFATFFIPGDRPGHFMFDLNGLTVERLKRAGVGHAASLDVCTYADEERFFSFRRTTHRKEPDYGRQISAISLKEV